MFCGLPWLLFGLVLADCALCPDEDGLKVIQICTDDTVTSDFVAIATDGLPATSTLNCSCTVTIYRVGDDRVPVLYFEGPGYPNCGIQISVGGLVFSCFPGFLNMQETFYDIAFRKTTTNGNPAACLLFRSANPNTQLKVTCHKSDIVFTRPHSSTSETTSTPSMATTPVSKSSIYATSTTSSHTPNRTTSFIESSTGSDKSSLPSSESSTKSGIGTSTKAAEPSAVSSTTSTLETNRVSTASSTVSHPASGLTDTFTDIGSTTTSLATNLGSTDFTAVTRSSSTPIVSTSSSKLSTDTPLSTTTTSHIATTLSGSVTSETHLPSVGSNITTIESQFTSSGSHSSFADSNITLTTTAKQTTYSSDQTSAATGSSGNVSSPITYLTRISTETRHKSSQKTTKLSLTSTTTPSFPVDKDFTTEIDSPISLAEDNNAFVIVISASSGFFAIILITITMVLCIRRYRKQLHRTILKQTNTTLTPAPYIDAFENETEIIIGDSVYFTDSQVMPKYRRVGTFKSPQVTPRGNLVHITDTSVKPSEESVSYPDTNVTLSELREHGHVISNSRATQIKGVLARPSFNPGKTETVIYAVVTKQPKSLAMPPRPKLISFKGIDDKLVDDERETADGRKPMTQFGVLQKRESLRAVKSVSKIKSDRELSNPLRKSQSQRKACVS